MDGHQLVQWLTVQAVDMIGTLLGHVDELARQKAQLQYQKKSNHEMKDMLHNQALAIDGFKHKRQISGCEAQAFVHQTRSEIPV